MSERGIVTRQITSVERITRTAEAAERKPVFLSFVLDTSGSMAGSKLTAVKTGLKAIVSQLTDEDLVFISTFNDEFQNLTPTPIPPSEVNWSHVDALSAGGRTRLYEAVCLNVGKLKRARRVPILALLTDGEDTCTCTSCRGFGHSAEDAAKLLQEPGVPNFHAVLLGVGPKATNALRTLSPPDSRHITLQPVEDSKRGVEQAFQFLQQTVERIQIVRTSTTALHLSRPRGVQPLSLSQSANRQRHDRSERHRREQRDQQRVTVLPDA
eukprot:gb/GEZN01011304.1/.p1 GENE.gb/GEZN01011304.1/~~gb/GEZN01011304.1/.p1  ORF type:complete len:268 (+),score=20.51 gb/GEZN01011304.1/:1-804(+)